MLRVPRALRALLLYLRKAGPPASKAEPAVARHWWNATVVPIRSVGPRGTEVKEEPAERAGDT